MDQTQLSEVPRRRQDRWIDVMTDLSEDSTIQTVIEDDASYRARLMAIRDHGPIDLVTGDALDEIGAKCRVYRVHTHTCAPAPRSNA